MSTLPLDATPQRATLQNIGLSITAGLLGFVCPLLPFLRLRRWHCAALMAVLWLLALYIFFERYAGVGFLGHLGLAMLGVLALIFPGRTLWLEAHLRRHRRALARWFDKHIAPQKS